MTDVEKVRVWPAEGVLIRDEVTGKPIEPGQEVPLTRAIARALIAGDLLRAAREDRQTGKDTRAAEGLRDKPPAEGWKDR